MVTNKSYRYNFGFRLLHYHLLAVHNVQTLAGIAHVATMEVECRISLMNIARNTINPCSIFLATHRADTIFITMQCSVHRYVYNKFI